MPHTFMERHSVRSLTIRAAALAAAVASLAACSDSVAVKLPTEPTVAPFMLRYAAIGNSITAGYQSGGIDDSTQKQSYARLLAHQAGTNYTYVALPKGCAPPIASFQTGARIVVTTADACQIKTSYPYLNNVAVPGATVADFVTPYTGSYSALTSFILSGRSQWRRAMDVSPTFVSVWLGNNDVLAAGVTGTLTPTAGVSPGVTPVKTITTLYAAGVDSLVRAGVKHGVLIGVVNVSQVPATWH